MRRLLAMLACTSVLMAGPCAVESWNIAINPGMGDTEPYLGVDLDFGDIDFVLPIVPFRD